MTSMLSGKIGIPEGAFKRLSNKQVESALELIVKNEVILQEIIQQGSGNPLLTPIAWARVKADGTIIVDEGFTSCTRTAIGKYRLDTDVTVGTSGSEPLSAVVVTPSSAVGDGGDGANPFKAFDTFQVVQTDTQSNIHFQYNSTNGKFYALGSNNDDFYIHTDATFTTAPVQVDAGAAIRTAPLSGALSREGGYVWKSGDANPIVSMKTSDNSLANYGGTPNAYIIGATDDINALAGSGPSGPRIWTSQAGDTIAYDPNHATQTLGSAVLTYTGLDTAVSSAPGIFDIDAYLWITQGSNLKQISTTAASYVNHAHPTETPDGTALAGSLGGGTRMAYDSVRNVLYVVLTDASPTSYLYTYSNWQNGVASSGIWEFVMKVGAGFCSISYEVAQDLLFVSHYSGNRVLRLAGYPKTLIDIVTVDNVAPPIDVNYDLESAYTSFYKSDSTGDYAYVSGSKTGLNYLIKISYNGADISLGNEGAVFGSVLVAHGTVIDTNTVQAELFRTISPPVRADGQFNIAVFGKT